MKLDKFILGKPEFDFFFRPKGEYRFLDCGHTQNGEFKSFRRFEFDITGRITKEIGYQSGWIAYPPGTTPPAPIQYLRKYTYENDLLRLVLELDYDSSQVLKSYEFHYSNQLIREIIETSENVTQHSSKRSINEYDTVGNLIKQVIDLGTIGDVKTYFPSEIIRNDKNQIAKITNFSSVENKGILVSKEEISSKEYTYTGNKVKEIIRYSDDESNITTKVELISNSDLIRTIDYPHGYKNREVYEYDENHQNMVKKSTRYEQNVVTELYRYK